MGIGIKISMSLARNLNCRGPVSWPLWSLLSEHEEVLFLRRASEYVLAITLTVEVYGCDAFGKYNVLTKFSTLPYIRINIEILIFFL
jgi:hypothetical protein